MSVSIKIDGPLEIDIDRLLNDTVDIYESIKTEFIPESTGALLRSNTFSVDLQNKRVEWKNVAPYAVIQDKGGTIPAVEGKLMVAYIDGAFRFFNKRKAFNITGKNYVNKMIDESLRRIEIHWKNERTG